MSQQRPVLVVDFGAQYAQLIARRVRECQVYSQIVPSTTSTAQMLAREPAAIILSGGPASVYAPGAPPAPEGLLDAGVPVLGICYGFQLMVGDLGRVAARTREGEHVAATLGLASGAAADAARRRRSDLRHVGRRALRRRDRDGAAGHRGAAPLRLRCPRLAAEGRARAGGLGLRPRQRS